jgi:ATP-binding cassette subfamily C (CFTR/MRP) protein 1
MTTGVLARAALIGSLYKRGVYLTPKARTQIPHAALVNHVGVIIATTGLSVLIIIQISTDVSRIDAAAQWFVSYMSFTN